MVNKVSYGIRMPVSILSIPFTFDNIFGYKSYSSLVQLPYKRIFSAPVKRNDIILFNNPNDTEKPLDKRSLLLSRCVGLPGDTVSVIDGKYFIDNKEYIPSPDMIESYSFSPCYADTVRALLKTLDIPERKLGASSDTVFSFYLTNFELYLIKQNLNRPGDLLLPVSDSVGYQFVIPYKGMHIKLNPENKVLYGQAIDSEMKKVDKKTNRSFTEEYTFRDDYYWMLCDNTIDSADSRTIGFIPHKSVIGKASVIWYSKGDSIRWERCISKID